jgi:hypothetical protein
LRKAQGTLVSGEHDPDWARYVRRLLSEENLDDIARVETVELAPLQSRARSSRTGRLRWPRQWYRIDLLVEKCPQDIDLLLVDGPPAFKQGKELIRGPAATVLAPHLAQGFTIVLDDVDRPAELETVRLWEAELGIEITVIKPLALAVGRSDGGFVPSL